ncbi:MAG: saccharopine dehydrogenase family protein [bacterium]
MRQTEFDIIVWGATGFTGQLVVQYLYKRYCDGKIRWAIAGRDKEKLLATRRSVGDVRMKIPCILADSHDDRSLRAMAASTKVVISTVGPYALYGSRLVKVCAEIGTDYCDLTGEVSWMRKMIDAHRAAAVESGARIVHTCGFDSIPSDMGVYFLQQQAQERFGSPLQRIDFYLMRAKGGFSGGTAHSLANEIDSLTHDPEAAKLAQSPYSLNPRPIKESPLQPQIRHAEFNDDIDGWVSPFIMGAINTRVVQRSNALSNFRYGESFLYREAQYCGGGFKGRCAAISATLMLASLIGGLKFYPTKALLKKFFLPKTGEGPAVDPKNPGYYTIRLVGKTEDGKTLSATVNGDADPGYGSTSKMLAEAAICLAQDIDGTETPGGFWTPSTAMGERLLERLQKNAGLSFELDICA